ncbi:MAG: sigma-54-dependent Fis family transcriptional regulator [Planctomycetes bacterium]|nr:sigma-54-dependent Fis family transcriptional regulator [Planctomycetota bacterium]
MSGTQNAVPAPVPNPPIRVLVVEDDASYGELLRYQLKQEGYEPILTRSGEEGLAKVVEADPAVILLDVMLPGKDGREVLAEIHQGHPDLPIVMMTAAGSVELAVECMKRGAVDFLAKPFDIERLYSVMRNAIQIRELKARVNALEGALIQKHAFDNIVAHSPIMRQVVEHARRAAQSDSDVLVLGESGSGKEVFARAIHFNSHRRKGPFVAINCGAIPEGLLESELFGHEKGSFTGAISRREGCFEQADGGTLFLDEIGEMRPDMQVRLLRALEQREVRRVGGDKTIKVNVRVISATNQDIAARIETSKFRADLYYRLAILVLEMPPLRQRPEDIGPLAQYFLLEARRDGHTRATGISPETLDVLMHYDWAGNVRELRNAIERAVVFEDSTLITVGSLPPEILRKTLGKQSVPAPKITETYSAETFKAMLAAAGGPTAFTQLPQTPQTIHSGGTTEVQRPGSGIVHAQRPISGVMPVPADRPIGVPPTPLPMAGAGDGEILTMDEEEKKILLRALAVTGGNISEAARRLGLHRSTLHRKMSRFGLATDDDTSGVEQEPVPEDER